MKLSINLVTLAICLTSAYAQQPAWAQCGGTGWTGGTTCVSGYTCVKVNDWYSQCTPGGATTVPPVTSQPPATTTAAPPTSTTSAPSSGFVKTSGTRFTLDGQKYTLVGSNSYWVGLSGHSVDNMNKAFADIASGGGTTVRTWGFNEVTSPNGIYYQSWSGGKATVNTGSTGLQNFDNVVAAAKRNNIKLIVALTNNWADYGGMDVYVNQILGQGKGHDLFYTDASTAFKAYIKAFVGRYVNEPTILGWELANEPRCRGSTSASTGTCTPATITAWAKEISAYIKSVDTNHLVALGDEGFFNQPGSPLYPYQGGEGIDFDANLQISTLDFGTAHLYPEHWGQANNITAFGNQWILDHQKSQARAGKPVILEEYGVTTDKPTVYGQWLGNIETSGLAGDLYWQAGSRLQTGNTHDDGYAVYPDQPAFTTLRNHASKMKARST